MATLEPCGAIRPGNAGQKGQGGITVYDVTNPERIHSIKRQALDTPIHNTFSWTTGEGNTYLMAVDDINANDVIIMDLSRPQSPKVATVTGIADWLADPTNPVADDGQLFTGVFQAPLLHDIWIEDLDPSDGENWVAVLSYWDAGFITLDVNDPYNPIFIDDSTYPETDPVLGISPAEGNAHAAVFGNVEVDGVGEISVIFGGDEDFDPYFTGVTTSSGAFAASQGSDVPQLVTGDDVTGTPVFVGLSCDPIPAAADPTDIAIVERGVCAFTDKVVNAQTAGYQAMVVFNGDAADRCEASVSMLIEGDIPSLFVARSAGFAILETPYDANA